jgi:hypothetical protein
MTVLSIVFSLKRNPVKNVHKKYHLFLIKQDDYLIFLSKSDRILSMFFNRLKNHNNLRPIIDIKRRSPRFSKDKKLLHAVITLWYGRRHEQSTEHFDGRG